MKVCVLLIQSALWDAVLVEDVFGKGHRSKAVGRDEILAIVVQLDE